MLGSTTQLFVCLFNIASEKDKVHGKYNGRELGLPQQQHPPTPSGLARNTISKDSQRETMPLLSLARQRRCLSLVGITRVDNSLGRQLSKPQKAM